MCHPCFQAVARNQNQLRLHISNYHVLLRWVGIADDHHHRGSLGDCVTWCESMEVIRLLNGAERSMVL